MPAPAGLPRRPAGELAGLQAEALAGSAAGAPRALLAAKPSQQVASRALLESNLAAALCLHSPHEYRRWLGTYAQLLSGGRVAGGGWAGSVGLCGGRELLPQERCGRHHLRVGSAAGAVGWW